MNIFKFYIFFNLVNLYIFGGCCNLNKNKNNNNLSKENNDDKNNNKDDKKNEENKKDKKNKKNVILLTTGALNPVHKGHINSLKLAQDYLENNGFNVEKIYLSPSSDIYLKNKLNNGRIDYYYNFEDRLKMCKLAIDDFKKENDNNKYNIEVSDWEGRQPKFVDFPDVIKHFQNDIKNRNKIIFYICGSDHYNKNVNLNNIVVIKRDEDIINLKNKDNNLIINDNSNSDFSSTKVRNIINKIKDDNDIDNNKKELEKYLYKSVIEYIENIKD